jgi:hypothetical protein
MELCVMDREMEEVVRQFGERFKKELGAEKTLPFPIALMLEHLRRAEEEGDAGGTTGTGPN